MVESGQYRLAKRMRLAARVIVLCAVVFGGTMLIGEAVSEILREGRAVTIEPLPEIVGFIVIGIIALAGCILSWWRERLAGILLVLTSAGLGIHIGLFAGRNHLLAWAMVGLPYLVAGALLISYWWLSKTGSRKPSEA